MMSTFLVPVAMALLAAGAPPPGMVFLRAALVRSGCIPGIMKPYIPLPPAPKTEPVRGFFLDRGETTAAAYQKCVAARACDPPSAKGASSNFGVPGREQHPMLPLSWQQADAYCRWAGKRLPTEAEWDRAAQGPELNYHPYPWGDAEPDCEHVAGVAALGVAQKNPSLCLAVDLAHPLPRTLAPCSRAPGNSPEGICDLAGNVAEWTSDWFVPLGRPLPSAPQGGAIWSRQPVFKGDAGAFSSPRKRERSACQVPVDDPPLTNGVRCARDVLGQRSPGVPQDRR